MIIMELVVKSYDPYYDGPRKDLGETPEERKRFIEEEKKRLDDMSDEEWKEELRRKFPLEADLIC